MLNPNVARTLFQSGVLLIGGSLVFAEAAWLHMRQLVQTYGVICGSGVNAPAHCPACYASLSLLAAGVTAVGLAHAHRPTVFLRARSNPSV